ncbi:MAG: TonB-dependent receptor domain-containing protein [Leptolyngbyaceae cyanobacterium]
MTIASFSGLNLLAISLWATVIAVPAAAAESVADVPRPDVEVATTAADLLAQDETTSVVITDIQIESTADGLTITLVSNQSLAAGAPQTVGNALITDIPNATLNLQDPAAAEQFGPTEGIALVQVSETPDGDVQIAITGTDGPPAAQLSTQGGNLVLNVLPGVATAIEDADAETIQVVVTATRTEEDILDVPQSVTVIDREQIQQQLQFTNNLPDILGELVPGLGPPTFQDSTRNLSLRGRTALILIDGVPQNPNSGFDTELNTIDPALVERIEIVRGPSAIYGDGATGGIINIITRTPIEEGVAYDIRVGTNVGLTSVEEDSFGYTFQAGVAAADEQADASFNLTYDIQNARFDAEGDRIPAETGIDDTDRVGLLTKLGYDLTEEQRVALTHSFYRESVDTDFISDPVVFEIPGQQTARALEIGSIDYEEEPQQTNHVINLTYRHTNLLGSQFDAQVYYRDTELTQILSDIRGSGRPDFQPQLFQTALDSLEWGGRAQFDTELSNSFSLLWGADYGQEENARVVLESDATTFNETGELVIIDELGQTPAYDLETFGVFAQATWDISEQWQLSGGLRYDTFDASVEDTVLAFRRNEEDVRTGGDIQADDVSFNAGLIYKPVPEIGIFASFSQGFSIPDIGLSAGTRLPVEVDISTDVALEPQQVNNYELGVRFEFGRVQASLAGFYSESELGSALQIDADGFTELVRAPQRNYGLEATLDWQPSDTWRLGGYFSWNEGENDVDDDGEFEALSSVEVQPYKLGLYVENDTTPGWTTRLQLLAVGDRDRALDEDVDGFAIDGYVTLDLLSSVQLGQGRLTMGVENLLNSQYLPVSSQERIGGTEERRYAAPGITLSLSYSIEF